MRMAGAQDASRSCADRFMFDGKPHEIEEKDKAAEGEEGFENMADHRLKLQQTAKCPAGSPGSADHFRTDQNGDRDQSRQMQKINLLGCRHVRTFGLKKVGNSSTREIKAPAQRFVPRGAGSRDLRLQSDWATILWCARGQA